MDRPALPLFDGRFSHYQMLFDESNSSGKVAPSHCIAGLTRVSLVPSRLGFDPLSSEYITEVFYFVGTGERFDGIDLQSCLA